MTECDVIRLLRLRETGAKRPERTLQYYRDKGLLKATQVGACLRYQLPDVLRFLEQARESNPR